MKEIIGISYDLSKARTGICVWRDKSPTDIFDVSFKNTHDIGELLAQFRNQLPNLMRGPEVNWIGFEDVRPINKHHSEIHFGMSGVLAEWAYRREIPLLRATSTKIKKRLAMSGKATKEEMTAAAREAYPYLNVQNHDQADALAVGLVAIDMIDWNDPESDLQSPF